MFKLWIKETIEAGLILTGRKQAIDINSIMGAPVTGFIGISMSIVCNIFMWIGIDSYSKSLILYNILAHGLSLIFLIKFLKRIQIFHNFIFFIMIFTGPITIYLSNRFHLWAISSSSIIPLLYVFISKKAAHSLCIGLVEGFKILYVYPRLLEDTLVNLKPEEIHKFLREEYYLTITMIFASIISCLGFYSWIHNSINSWKEATEKLGKINQELENSLESQEQFLLSFSHEFRNPLNSMLGNIELAYEDAKNLEIKNKLKYAKISGELVLGLLNNTLDSAKAQMNKLEICNIETEPNRMIEKMWMIWSEIIRSKGLSPYMRISNNVPHKILIDPYRLAQVLYNLISNAVKFTDKGQIKLSVTWLPKKNPEDVIDESTSSWRDELDTVAEEESDLFSRLDRFPQKFRPNLALIRTEFESDYNSDNEACDKGTLILLVQDTGMGMSKEDQVKLFSRFSQVGAKEKRKLGSGLGLFISRQICQKMGGKIFLESHLGKGTTFTVMIPCTVVKTEHKMTISRTVTMASDYLTAIVVEDELYNQQIIKRFLNQNNVDVYKIAKNGQQALEIYTHCLNSNITINFITMDLEMPIMDGKTSCIEIRKLEIARKIAHVPIIIISGNCILPEIEACLSKTGSPILCKKACEKARPRHYNKEYRL